MRGSVVCGACATPGERRRVRAASFSGLGGDSGVLGRVFFTVTGPADRKAEIDGLVGMLARDLRVDARPWLATGMGPGTFAYDFSLPDGTMLTTLRAEISARLRSLNGLGAPAGSSITTKVTNATSVDPLPDPAPLPVPVVPITPTPAPAPSMTGKLVLGAFGVGLVWWLGRSLWR